ncbi:hypothetical protein QN219_00565 [Sinorhizobium sp. 7-81]|uniref:hypothetical protein n=1 Tax=Sinorhizobium sp. 8-89 TaxID=3049089 RepID=UPI0024C44CC1|nr:hypothetical protein [Sinorhizobium sp. 8-89]MDK1488559.1 hypothetical protein [Sinorhizobium sp. 8-89]
MDMMAMAYLFDMLSKNRRWEESFEPRQPRRRALMGRLISTITRKLPPEKCREDCGRV